MIDLHLHLDGSLRVGTIIDLAREEQRNLPADTPEELNCYLKVSGECTSLNDYLKCFDLPLLLLQRPSAVERVVFELIEDLSNQGIEYAEIRFAPQLSTNNGYRQEDILKAAIKGQERANDTYRNIRTSLILCCMRGKSYESNTETVELAGDYLNRGVCAIDLAGAEALYPTETYQDIFQMAKARNIPFTIHAGEAAGPDSIRKALDFGALRIGHGVRVVEDTALLDRIIREQVPLEICVSSNIQTRTFDSCEDHPIRRLYELGAAITVNTDNMTVSDTTLQKEFDILREKFHFSEAELKEVTDNARKAAFSY